MGVDSAGAEGGDSRAAGDGFGSAVLLEDRRFPFFEGPLDIERRLVERNFWIEIVGVEGGHKSSVFHLQQDFDNARDNGTGFQVPDIGFYGTDSSIVRII